MLAYTYFGGKHYWTTIDQIPEYGGCTYIIDEVALVEMLEKFGEEIDFVTILIKKDAQQIGQLVDAERIKRDEQRLKLNDDFYDIVITNNGTINDLRKQIEKKMFGK